VQENKYMRRITMVAVSIVALSLVSMISCTDNSTRNVMLDETPVISGGLGWGVVSFAYVRLMQEPSVEADDSGTARRGDVGRIVARSRSFEDKSMGVWYKLELGTSTGWLHESTLTVQHSEAEARKVAEAGS
jgi:hypothetical protein